MDFVRWGNRWSEDPTMKRIKNTTRNILYGLDLTNSWIDCSREIDLLPSIITEEIFKDLHKKAVEEENSMIIKNSYISVNDVKYRLDELEIDNATDSKGAYLSEPIARAKFRICQRTRIPDPNAPKVKVTKASCVNEISKVIFNYPATIVFWSDNTKTVVKCKEGDQWDPHAGLSAAIAKKIFGSQINKLVKNAEYSKLPPEEEKK